MHKLKTTKNKAKVLSKKKKKKNKAKDLCPTSPYMGVRL